MTRSAAENQYVDTLVSKCIGKRSAFFVLFSHVYRLF